MAKDGGEMRLDRGRRRVLNGNDEATHERVIQGSAGGSIVDSDPEKWVTSSLANHDPKKVARNTRRLARRKMRDASRNFHRCRAVPEDEEMALAHRRLEQEAEWHSLLYGKKAASGSRASCVSSITDVTKATSLATAGIKSQDAAWRADSFPQKPPLPLERVSRIKPSAETNYEDYKAADGSERLARLLRMDMRP